MRKSRFKIWQQTIRRALFIGVFLGLLFSCGEGIRLFPFSDGVKGKAGYEFIDKSETIYYQLSVHRFENSSVNFAAKQQLKQFQPLPFLPKTKWLPRLVVGKAAAQLWFLSSDNIKRQFYYGVISSRAPPFKLTMQLL